MEELHLTTREEWHRWLEKNHLTREGTWLVYYKKHSGKPRIPYNDAVEEALCFGWIDGKIKRVNDAYFKQWFTPRRPGSRWSKINIDRAKKLMDSGLMTPAGIKVFQEVLDFPERIYDNKAKEDPGIPSDLLTALKKSEKALGNFMNFSPSARKIYILWLNSAKREETRVKRIARITGFAEQNIRPGMF